MPRLVEPDYMVDVLVAARRFATLALVSRRGNRQWLPQAVSHPRRRGHGSSESDSTAAQADLRSCRARAGDRDGEEFHAPSVAPQPMNAVLRGLVTEVVPQVARGLPGDAAYACCGVARFIDEPVARRT